MKLIKNLVHNSLITNRQLFQKLAQSSLACVGLLLTNGATASDNLLAPAYSAQSDYFVGETKAVARVGLDSNPFRLADDLPSGFEEFGFAAFRTNDRVADLFYWNFGVDKTYYYNDSRGDFYNADLEFKLASSFNIYEQKFAYDIGAGLDHHDETYVNRENGYVATYNAISIADRFDQTTNKAFATFAYFLDDSADIFYRYHEAESRYETYAIDGLDNLNYREVTNTIGTHLSPRDEGEYFFQFSHHLREYDERLDRDREGLVLADTPLILNRYETRIGYRHSPDEKNRWEYAFSYINRTSDTSDYYESQRGVLNIKGQHWLADFHLLNLDIQLQTYFYDESLEQSSVYFDIDDIEQKGATITLEYNWILAKLYKTHLAFYTNLQVAFFDSPDPFYVYQRNQVSAGIRWALD